MNTEQTSDKGACAESEKVLTEEDREQMIRCLTRTAQMRRVISVQLPCKFNVCLSHS